MDTTVMVEEDIYEYRDQFSAFSAWTTFETLLTEGDYIEAHGMGVRL